MSKCKTCGRTISYGYGNNYWNSFEQKVGKVNKDSWKKAIEQNCTISADTDKNISYKVNNIPEKIYETGGYYEVKKRVSLFCRLNCMNVFFALHYDYFYNLPNIVNKD